MFRNFKLQFLLVAGLAGLLGYAAANPKLNPFAKEDGARAEQPRQTDPPPHRRIAERRLGRPAYPRTSFLGAYRRNDQGIHQGFSEGSACRERRAERTAYPDGRRGLRRTTVWRPNSDADLRPPGQERPALHAVPYLRPARLPAPPCSPAQPPFRRDGLHHGSGTGFPGYNTLMPKVAARSPRCCGRTATTPPGTARTTISPTGTPARPGPFDLWPTGLGFEYFYGFIGGDTSQWAPAIFEGIKPVEPPHDDKKYFFEKDMADHAIDASACCTQSPRISRG